MLAQWTSPQSSQEATVLYQSHVMLDSTQIVDKKAFQSDCPDTQPNEMPSAPLAARANASPGASSHDFSLDSLIAESAAAAIEEGRRQSDAFEKRKGQGSFLIDGAPGSSPVARPVFSKRAGRAAVQSPKQASEGSVSLVDHATTTHIRFRRLNPTAPRQQPRGYGHPLSKFISSVTSFLVSRGFFSGRKAAAKFVTLALIVAPMLGVILGFYLLSKRRAPQIIDVSDTENSRVHVPISPSIQDKKKSLQSRPLSKESQGKIDTSSTSAMSRQIFSNAVDLRKYLAKSHARSFVVIGPLTLRERPRQRCSPCIGQGVLADGTVVKLSSVESRPWNKVGKNRVVYAKGFLLGSETFTLMINTMSQKPM
jgi:hypothetical protein